jgi:hypothetical protein
MQAPIIPISSSNAELADVLRKLWPHRKNESDALRSVMCYFGFHRWTQMNLEHLLAERKVRFCRSCPGVEIDGVIYRN